eukprot:6200442-Pleurochrysis_carterae.AAC.5
MKSAIQLNSCTSSSVFLCNSAPSVFAKHPLQATPWGDLEDDSTLADFCIHGCASWALSAARSQVEAGHSVPFGALLEVNLEYMHRRAVCCVLTVRCACPKRYPSVAALTP